jgi:tetratricopeptide (TPR) repeat protein
MKTPLIRSSLFLASALIAAASLSAQAPKIEFPAASPAATLKQRVGLTDIEINYSRPSLKGRVVVGKIDPYGKVWRTGANSATRISFSTPVKLEGSKLDAGTYELFTIPSSDEWTVILQKAGKQWGAYQYKEANDSLRVKTKPVALASPVETFTIGINDIRDESATLNLVWADWRVPVKVEVDVVSTLVPQIEAVMASDAAKKPYAQAAMFYRDHDLDLKKAAAWFDAAIAEQPNAYYYLYHKATILAKMGDKAGALAMARQSIELASKDKDNVAAKDEYTRLNEALIASLQ